VFWRGNSGGSAFFREKFSQEGVVSLRIRSRTIRRHSSSTIVSVSERLRREAFLHRRFRRGIAAALFRDETGKYAPDASFTGKRPGRQGRYGACVTEQGKYSLPFFMDGGSGVFPGLEEERRSFEHGRGTMSALRVSRLRKKVFMVFGGRLRR